MTVPSDPQSEPLSWGLENSGPVAAWTRITQKRLRELGEKLQAGDLKQVEGLGLQRHIGIASRGDTELCVGFKRTLSAAGVVRNLKKYLNQMGLLTRFSKADPLNWSVCRPAVSPSTRWGASWPQR